MLFLIAALVPFLIQTPQPPAATSAPIKFEPSQGVPTFAVREPVLRVAPGSTVETRTFSKPGDYYEKPGGAWPGEVGPFYIEGATPDDTLVVRILRLRPNRDSAVSAVAAPDGPRAFARSSIRRTRFSSRLRFASGSRSVPANAAGRAARTAAKAEANL